MFDVVYTEIRNNNHQEKGRNTDRHLGRLCVSPDLGPVEALIEDEERNRQLRKISFTAAAGVIHHSRQIRTCRRLQIEREGPMHVCRQTVHKPTVRICMLPIKNLI
jgi:hypothetical protein